MMVFLNKRGDMEAIGKIVGMVLALALLVVLLFVVRAHYVKPLHAATACEAGGNICQSACGSGQVVIPKSCKDKTLVCCRDEEKIINVSSS